MKKKIGLSVLALALALVGGIYYWAAHSAHTSTNLSAPSITPEELKQMIAQNDNFFVYFYSPTCPNCIKAEPLIAKAVQSSKVTLVELNVKAHPEAKAEFQVPGTPTLYYYSDHKLAKGVTGAGVSYQVYLDFFRKASQQAQAI